jgi:translation initiation factor IF-1
VSTGPQRPPNPKGDQQRGDTLAVEGVILTTLPKALFRVQLDSGERVTASLSSQAKRITIKLLPGDRVSIETSPFDPTRGRITGRL